FKAGTGEGRSLSPATRNVTPLRHGNKAHRAVPTEKAGASAGKLDFSGTTFFTNAGRAVAFCRMGLMHRRFRVRRGNVPGCRSGFGQRPLVALNLWAALPDPDPNPDRPREATLNPTDAIDSGRLAPLRRDGDRPRGGSPAAAERRLPRTGRSG